MEQNPYESPLPDEPLPVDPRPRQRSARSLLRWFPVLVLGVILVGLLHGLYVELFVVSTPWRAIQNHAAELVTLLLMAITCAAGIYALVRYKVDE